MKLSFAVLILMAQVLHSQTYLSPVKITRFSGAQLHWTNQVAANGPIYEVLRTSTLPGDWQPYLSVTNATSVSLTNSTTTENPAVFYKLQWTSDEPIVFNYEFEETGGFGGPCVFGQLLVSFTSPGGWLLDDTGGCLESVHVTGVGTLTAASFNYTAAPQTVRLRFTTPPNDQYMDATLQGTHTNGSLSYTGMVGTVYQNGFGGGTPIGTFRAQRTQ